MFPKISTILLNTQSLATPLKQIQRFRRIQQRKPLAVYKNFAEASAAEQQKKKQNKPVNTKQPQQQQAQGKQKAKVIVNNIDAAKMFEKLQREADRVYVKHDPFYQMESPTDQVKKDIEQNVDYVASAMQHSETEIDVIELPDGDQRFGPNIQVAKSLRYRHEKQKILLEGKRLVSDALESGVKFENIYFLKNLTIKTLGIDVSALSPNVNVYKISHKAISTWSDVETSQGILATAKMPGQGECNYKRDLDLPILLVLDQIRDPGNMGTIIRSAAAMGCQRILVSKGCVDVWDSKVIRSGMGAHFRIPMITKLSYEEIDTYLPMNTVLLYADSEKSNANQLKVMNYSRFVESAKGIPHVTLIIGNESVGINEKFQNKTKIKKENQAIIHVPLANGVESLNASIAFSVIGYELRKLFNK